MKDINLFSGEKRWLKGNLHCHTNVSDGKRFPQEKAKIYKKLGYHFLAFTDHNIFNAKSFGEEEDFQLLPGVELNIEFKDRPGCYHIVGFGARGEFDYAHGKTFTPPYCMDCREAQMVIDDINAHHGLAIVAHPVWCLTELRDFENLTGYVALEAYNHNCYFEGDSGYADFYWDNLLKRGRMIKAVAVDDSHDLHNDIGGGWVMVWAKKNSQDSIVEALRNGDFYSSAGPEIHSCMIHAGFLEITCSPAAYIHCIPSNRPGKTEFAEERPLTEARFDLKGLSGWVRAEVVDVFGKKAWTNAIILE